MLSEAVAAGHTISSDAWLAALLTFFAALAAIAFLMALVKRRRITKETAKMEAEKPESFS